MTCCWKRSIAEFPEVSPTGRWSSFGILWVLCWLLCTEISLPDQALRKKTWERLSDLFHMKELKSGIFFFLMAAEDKNMRWMDRMWGERFYGAGVRATPHFRIAVTQKSTMKHSLTSPCETD